MNFWRPLYGIFKKELALQSRSRLNILNRLLIGPVISVVTVGILYAGFFSTNRHLVLGPLSSNNFVGPLLLGFLAHAYMNAGYYFFSNKILNEWIGRTLPLVWIAPCSRGVLFLGMLSVEALRCTILTALVMGGMSLLSPLPVHAYFLPVIFMPAFLALGAGLGLLRSYLFLLNEGKAELMDHLYLALIFLSCFYIPQAILPGAVKSLCLLSPGYHGMNLWLALSQGRTIDWPSAVVFPLGIALAFLLAQALWAVGKLQIQERSYG